MSLAQGNNTPTRPRIEPGSPDLESDALTTRPVRSLYLCFVIQIFGLNSIYLIINIHVDIHTMLCETGSGSKHKAYIEAIS